MELNYHDGDTESEILPANSITTLTEFRKMVEVFLLEFSAAVASGVTVIQRRAVP